MSRRSLLQPLSVDARREAFDIGFNVNNSTFPAVLTATFAFASKCYYIFLEVVGLLNKTVCCFLSAKRLRYFQGLGFPTEAKSACIELRFCQHTFIYHISLLSYINCDACDLTFIYWPHVFSQGS